MKLGEIMTRRFVLITLFSSNFNAFDIIKRKIRYFRINISEKLNGLKNPLKFNFLLKIKNGSQVFEFCFLILNKLLIKCNEAVSFEK